MILEKTHLDTLSRDVLTGAAWWSACIAALQWFGAIMEYWRDQPVLLWLDVASGMASASAALASVSPLPISARRNLAVVLIALTVLLEVETAFHDPEYHFSDARLYLILIVSMLFLAMIFPHRPAVFIASALAYVGYYIARGAMVGNSEGQSHTATVYVIQLLFSVVVCSGIHFWIFKLRYSNIVQAEDLRRAQTKLGRQMMLRDIHDHLGARLADLSNLVARVRRDRSDEMFATLEKAAAEAATLLRQGLLIEHDRELLAEDFAGAIRVILFGRYEAAGRQILFRFPDERTEAALARLGEELRGDLLAMVIEITTNDLKYGRLMPVLAIDVQGAALRIRFLAETTHPYARGLGRDTLRKRVAAHGGRLASRSLGRKLFIRIQLPGVSMP